MQSQLLGDSRMANTLIPRICNAVLAAPSSTRHVRGDLRSMLACNCSGLRSPQALRTPSTLSHRCCAALLTLALPPKPPAPLLSTPPAAAAGQVVGRLPSGAAGDPRGAPPAEVPHRRALRHQETHHQVGGRRAGAGRGLGRRRSASGWRGTRGLAAHLPGVLSLGAAAAPCQLVLPPSPAATPASPPDRFSSPAVSLACRAA